MDDSAKVGHIDDTNLSARDASRQPDLLSKPQILSLCDVIHGKVIPELCGAPASDDPAGTGEGLKRSAAIGAVQRADLASAVIEGDARRAVRTLGEIAESGVSVEQVYLDLLAPLARDLGEKWEQDKLDFLSITAALGILQTLLHTADRRAPLVSAGPESNRIIALARVPGDQHILGILTVSRFFERAGWQVVGGPDREYDDGFIQTTAETGCRVAGLSIGSEAKLQTAANVVAKLRTACRKRKVAIVVGGPVVGRDPSLAGALGADAMAEDARRAVAVAESLV